MSAPISKGTLTQLFYDAVERHGHKPKAVACKPAGGAWRSLTHQELAQRVQRAGLALKRLGVRRGDRVAILSENRPGWLVADFACLAVGASDVPLYPTLPARQLDYILKDSGAVAIFVSTAPQLAKIAELRGELPALKHVITMDPDARGPGVIGLAELYAMGAEAEAAGEGANFKAEALSAKPDDAATIIYTSGTTGDPKGVVLSHDNIFSNVMAVLEVFRIGPTDSTLSFLPLSHIFERMAGHYTMFYAGATIHYAESVDTVPANLMEVSPTIVTSVPRLYEKMYARVLENALAGGPVKKRIFFWAKDVGERWADHTLAGERPPTLLGWQYALAHRLVFSKLKTRTGGQLRFFVSGGAPLPADIAKFFYSAGLPILEGYGLTETSPVICANLLDHVRIGTVGPPIPGVEVKIAPDGEILTRGRHVMKGYFNQPEATHEALDADGWFHTGDIGELDAEGCLKITDRKKDLIVTAGGKNVAPQMIETALQAHCPLISQVVVFGDNRPHCVAIVTLSEFAARQFGDGNLARAASQPELRAAVEDAVAAINRTLASYETIKNFAILPKDFSEAAGELTPSLKVKREVVRSRHGHIVEALYNKAE